ncbi:hypothetical protein BC941DRAFT_435337 [Chlamydoabsidia padenii]|nr:hypothetical protein BC941DRAFT_435337 [Chlamydoabsidia padenii]
MDQNNQPQNTITKEQTLLSSPTLLTTVSPTPTKVPLPTIPQDKELEAKATQLMDLLTYRDRERLDIYGDHLKLNPNDSKGYLKNLVTKIDGGLYSSSTEFIQIEKTRSIYVATVEFGTKDIKMTLTQVGSRKTEAECKAAMAIYKLLQTAAKVINNQMDLLYY